MTQSVREVMTGDPVAMSATTTLPDAAKAMLDQDIGDVIVLDQNDAVCGIVTDRDIVVRTVALGQNPADVRLGDICSRDLTTISPTGSAEDAVRLMRGKAVRRLPVVEDGRPIGVVSLGDLAMDRDPDSALADISAAPANT